jgi:methylmalonyl-CoA mutase C-terminal domain/subunit
LALAERKIRILVAKPGLDGHDVGAKVVVRALVDAGFEVIYTGLRQSPERIAVAALEEGVDVIALSILSGSHIPICRRLKELLVQYKIDNKLWIVGGNIPKQDRQALLDIGVDGVFATGSKLEDIVAFIKEQTHERAA